MRHSASTNWNATRGAQDGLGEASGCCLLFGRTFLCIIIHQTLINTHSRGMCNGQARRGSPELQALSETLLNVSIHYKAIDFTPFFITNFVIDAVTNITLITKTILPDLSSIATRHAIPEGRRSPPGTSAREASYSGSRLHAPR